MSISIFSFEYQNVCLRSCMISLSCGVLSPFQVTTYLKLTARHFKHLESVHGSVVSYSPPPSLWQTSHLSQHSAINCYSNWSRILPLLSLFFLYFINWKKKTKILVSVNIFIDICFIFSKLWNNSQIYFLLSNFKHCKHRTHEQDFRLKQ